MNEVRLELDQKLWDQLNDPRFALYFNELIEKNKVTNLTNITEEKEVYQKHFYDSVILNNVLDLKNKSLLDVGAGAGFPSFPLKIINEDLQVMIVDSLNKRIDFLKDLANKLNFSNVSLLHARAEELDKKHLFDFVTARAVARLNILTELCLPYVKIGGYFIAYKSIHYQEELKEAENAIAVLGGKIEKIINYEINQDLRHVLVLIKKIKQTPSVYPRSFGKIKKAPL